MKSTPREMSGEDHAVALEVLKLLIQGKVDYNLMRVYVASISGTRLEKLFRMLWIAVYNKDNAEFQRLLHIAYTTSYIWMHSGLKQVQL